MIHTAHSLANMHLSFISLRQLGKDRHPTCTYGIRCCAEYTEEPESDIVEDFLKGGRGGFSKKRRHLWKGKRLAKRSY